MSIKNLGPNPNSDFKQGYYKPLNPHKYIGNEKSIIYRSSWEKKFMIKCDNRDDVLTWSSEPVSIRYFSSWDNKYHTYYPDFYMKTCKQDGTIEEFLVEIKPHQQIQKPQKPKKRSKKALRNYQYLAEQYIKNRDKYAYAQKWAEERGMRFIVMTEKSLK